LLLLADSATAEINFFMTALQEVLCIRFMSSYLAFYRLEFMWWLFFRNTRRILLKNQHSCYNWMTVV